MSRQLKFRIWDTIYGFYMIYEPKVFGYRFPTDEEKSKSLYTKPHNRYYNLDECCASERFHVEQFTGLSDIAGVEVYENDIIEYDFPYLSEHTSRLGIVKYTKSFSGYQYNVMNLDDSMGGDGFYGGLPNDEYKVIGNINENPELLDMKI